MKKTFKTYLTESQRLPHWPKTIEELEEAYSKVCVDDLTGEVMMPPVSKRDQSNFVTFNDDLTVSIGSSSNGRVSIEPWMLVDGYLPFPFKEVFVPIEVDRDCEVKSLAGFPLECDDLSFGENALDASIKNLIGGPNRVNESFSIGECGIESLEGFPTMRDDCSIFLTTKTLKDFRKLPKRVRHLTIGSSKHFTHESFEHLPEYAYLIAFSDVPNLYSLHNLHKHVKTLAKLGLFKTRITSAILSLALIKGLQEVDPEFFNVKDMSWAIDGIDQIVNKYIGTGEIFDFQEELEMAGQKELAKL